MQHFPKPLTQFLNIKFNSLPKLTENSKNQFLYLLQSYSGTTSTAANAAKPKPLNINYLYSWVKVISLTQVTKNMYCNIFPADMAL